MACAFSSVPPASRYGCAKRVATDADARAEIGGAALDHAPGVDAVHRVFGQDAGAADGGAEQGSLAAVADDGRHDVGVEVNHAANR